MRHDYLEKSLGFLKFQRNLFAIVTLILSGTTLILSVLLFSKRERVVIVPPRVEMPFWVDKHAISATYLEQYGYFLAQLLLSKSAESAESQRDVLLRNTDPAYVPHLRKRLLEEEELLHRQSTSYVFYPTSISARPRKGEVLIDGERCLHVSDRKLSSQRESYLLRFQYTGSRLLLTEIVARESTDD